MKLYFSIFALVLLAACNRNGTKQGASDSDSTLLSTNLVNNPNTANGIDSSKLNTMPTLDFIDSVHDFGTINEGENVVYEFPFTNHGVSPLIISNATGSCGCTVADYPHEPVLAGKSGILKVQFNSAGKSGHQEKTVSISSNARGGIHTLLIKTEVTPGKREIQPVQ